MAVHKADRAAWRKLIVKNGLLTKRRAALMRKVLTLKTKMQKIEHEANGILVSADEIQTQIEYNNASIRGYDS